MIHEDMFVSNFKADGAIGDGIAFAINLFDGGGHKGNNDSGI